MSSSYKEWYKICANKVVFIMENASIVPVMDVNRGYGYGDGFCNGGSWFMWIIVLFALTGGWGNGYGRNGAGLNATGF